MYKLFGKKDVKGGTKKTDGNETFRKLTIKIKNLFFFYLLFECI
jgi:hypothetical protein